MVIQLQIGDGTSGQSGQKMIHPSTLNHPTEITGIRSMHGSGIPPLHHAVHGKKLVQYMPDLLPPAAGTEPLRVPEAVRRIRSTGIQHHPARPRLYAESAYPRPAGAADRFYKYLKCPVPTHFLQKLFHVADPAARGRLMGGSLRQISIRPRRVLSQQFRHRKPRLHQPFLAPPFVQKPGNGRGRIQIFRLPLPCQAVERIQLLFIGLCQPFQISKGAAVPPGRIDLQKQLSLRQMFPPAFPVQNSQGNPLLLCCMIQIYGTLCPWNPQEDRAPHSVSMAVR